MKIDMSNTLYLLSPFKRKWVYIWTS